MTHTEAITYRLFEDADLPGLLNLWEHHSGWGPISAETFRQWNFNGPRGRNLIVIAENESGEIVGQGILAPAKLWLHGKEVNVLRIAAPILHESVRQQNIRSKDHPAVQLISYAFEAAWAKGYDLIYALPAFGWVPMLKMLPLFGLPYGAVTVYECFSIPLSGVLPEAKSALTVQMLNGSFDERYDMLWADAVVEMPISVGIVRNKAWLKWKLGSCTVLEVYRKEQFLGYAAIDKKGLLVDMLARTQCDLRAVLLAVHQHLSQERSALENISAINGMLTPLMASVLQGITYEKEKYQFAFGYYPNTEKVIPDQLKPAIWYIMPND